MFDNIYSGKKVLITGHTGFKGAWLSSWLKMLGAEVYGISDGIPTSPSNFEASGLDKSIRNVYLDIRNRNLLLNAFQEIKPDIVFHLAAQALVRKSYQNPTLTFETNVIGTLNVLECVRRLDTTKALVLITSDKAYRNVEWVWGYREDDALGGADPYSASKGCAEIVAHSYFDSFFNVPETCRCATTRAGNVIGGGDWAEDRIVPDCYRAWAKGTPVEIRSPLATRPWQLVLEPLSGYLQLGMKLYQEYGDANPIFAGESFNFGPSSDSVHTVADVVNSLGIYWDNFHNIAVPNRNPSMNECTLLKLSCDKALAYMKWRATLNFDETLQFTAEWYRVFRENPFEAKSITTSQIERYCSLAESRGAPWI